MDKTNSVPGIEIHYWSGVVYVKKDAKIMREMKIKKAEAEKAKKLKQKAVAREHKKATASLKKKGKKV